MEKTHTFNVWASSPSNLNSAWESKTAYHALMTDIPPEFNGQGNGHSPEDLYALSLANCFLATFKVIAAKSKLQFDFIEVMVSLKVAPNENNITVMLEADLDINLKGSDNPDRALRILTKTPEHCMILNSVKTNLNFKYYLI